MNAAVVLGCSALLLLILWRTAGPIWGAVTGVVGLFASGLVLRRTEAQTWRLTDGVVTCISGDHTDTLRLEDVVAISAWELSDSLHEMFFVRGDERGMGLPLRAVDLIAAIGDELRIGGFTPTMDKVSSNLLGFARDVGGR